MSHYPAPSSVDIFLIMVETLTLKNAHEWRAFSLAGHVTEVCKGDWFHLEIYLVRAQAKPNAVVADGGTAGGGSGSSHNVDQR
jgi:hypothetical protein